MGKPTHVIITTKEPRTLEVVGYKANGIPTCATDFIKGDICTFLRIRGMCGKQECCSVTGDDVIRDKDHGFLVPSTNCPLWRK